MSWNYISFLQAWESKIAQFNSSSLVKLSETEPEEYVCYQWSPEFMWIVFKFEILTTENILHLHDKDKIVNAVCESSRWLLCKSYKTQRHTFWKTKFCKGKAVCGLQWVRIDDVTKHTVIKNKFTFKRKTFKETTQFLSYFIFLKGNTQISTEPFTSVSHCRVLIPITFLSHFCCFNSFVPGTHYLPTECSHVKFVA